MEIVKTMNKKSTYSVVNSPVVFGAAPKIRLIESACCCVALMIFD